MRSVREGIEVSDTYKHNLTKRLTGNKYRIGCKISPEHKEKIRQASLGRLSQWKGVTGEAHPNWRGKQIDHTCERCGKVFRAYTDHRKGKHVFCSRECQGLFMCGERSSAWRGGSKDKYPIEFKRLRKSIRDRDNNKCVICGKTRADNNNQALSVHHIDYNKCNLEDSNLITLCLSCHAKTNYKREDWEIYLTDLLRCNPTKD